VTAHKTGEASAVAAAQAVAREHGVACDEAVPIAAGSNVLEHLKPAPVVTRVMTGTAVLHDDIAQWLAREVAVAAFLAEGTDLAVAPSDLLPPGPHERDAFWMTLWTFVSHDAQAPPPEPRELGRSLRELHAALAGFPGELAPLSGIGDWLGRLLAELRPSPSLSGQDIDWLRLKRDALTPAVFESSLPAQALHGDASVGNLLRTPGGLIWNDFEDVCAGPVAWDICGLMASATAAGRGRRSRKSCSLPTVIRALKTWRRSSRRTPCTRWSGRRTRAGAGRGPWSGRQPAWRSGAKGAHAAEAEDERGLAASAASAQEVPATPCDPFALSVHARAGKSSGRPARLPCSRAAVRARDQQAGMLDGDDPRVAACRLVARKLVHGSQLAAARYRVEVRRPGRLPVQAL
jgi:hypothetical protein